MNDFGDTAPYHEGMSGISNWPPALTFGLGALIGALLVGIIWVVGETLRRGKEVPAPTLAVTTESFLEAVPIPTVVFSDSMHAMFHNSAYRTNSAVVRSVINKEWLQRAILRVILEGKGVSRRSDPDNQQSVHIVPLPDNLVAVMVWDESQMYSADAMRQDFIANASHELNTPVSAILLLSEALLRSTTKDPNTRRFVNALHGEAERLSLLTRDIGQLASAQERSSQTPADPTSVKDVVNQTVLNHSTLAKAEGVRLVWNPEKLESDPLVAIDPRMLDTALGNLVENAIQHSPAGSEVTVSIRESESAGYVRIAVADQGPGIAPEHVDKIFQRFYRVDASRQRKSGGTGLGLSIARNVARGAGGEVSVKTFPGQGATFVISLPVSKASQGVSE